MVDLSLEMDLNYSKDVNFQQCIFKNMLFLIVELFKELITYLRGFKWIVVTEVNVHYKLSTFIRGI
jgi:hypothetical protein